MRPLSDSPLYSPSAKPDDIAEKSQQLQKTLMETTTQDTPQRLQKQTPTSIFHSTMPQDIVDAVLQSKETLKEQTLQYSSKQTTQRTPASSFSLRKSTPLSKSLIHSAMPKDIDDALPQGENTPKEQTPQQALEQSTQQTPTSSFSPQALSLVAQSPSPSFSLRQSTTPLSPSLSPSAMQQDIGDTFYDSVLIYVDEKSVLQLSCEDSTPEQSMIQYHQSTTFAADLLNDDSIEVDEEEEGVDNTLNFIDNRAPSPVRKMLNSASIDARLWSFISEINEDYALLTFLRGNFKVLIKFDLQDEDNLEVIINEISLQCLIDQNIKEKGWTRISDEAVHLLTKPRDAKLIKIIKNLAEARFEKFKQDTCITTPVMLNDVLKGLCKIFNRLEALTVELADLSLRHECKITNADINSFEIALETYGLRYTLWVVLCLDLTAYPDYSCKVKFGVHKADLKLYPYHLLNRAVKKVSPGDSDYLRSIMRATKKFIFDYRRKHSIKSVRISFHHTHQ
ncbi:uncharacterized protein LOC107363360 [Tetranychus urticae]|uniref:Uncharacterized protein n=1 Tax=Tetranychus urticae TaxID=32264 RepID=T1KEL9_TETUR|nr:uncharacterized protein LOC107363360 [Tetranychus urticae]